jgi:hypothetical protein
VNKTRKEYVRLRWEIADADAAHERKLKRIDKKIRELRTKCKHAKTTFHGDPAGGFDSYSECIDCGKHL